ncbi:deoxyribonuclease II family protein [Azospirillum sp. B4]|uniref:deoxyribonuclease II family protein n=1 Tax=Azospirillum sp. B4 TaxID=95605 RepID=UPI0005CAD88D|nr:deoxyribonuclease II family protein [Azospirillum sp. B4]
MGLRGVIALSIALWTVCPAAVVASSSAPGPVVSKDTLVDWWFAFKFNGREFPGCQVPAQRQCRFGGTVSQDTPWGLRYAYASTTGATLREGGQCLGDTDDDPVGATFDLIYNHDLHYVIWNDQLKGDPSLPACGENCDSPWGHAKGVVAWDDSGAGFVMQGTTPAWPVSGHPGLEVGVNGNTLGCTDDNNVKFSQHFFALRLTKDDLIMTLGAMANASVATAHVAPGDTKPHQLVYNGGPADVQAAVTALGVKSKSREVKLLRLSSGVRLISKPFLVHVPPWQLVSSKLGGVDLRIANWSEVKPRVGSSTRDTPITCWDDAQLPQKPGAVDIAITGNWDSREIGLKGGVSNHAKFGVTSAPESKLVIFGDMNQQGTLSGVICDSSQNGRGGMFFVVEDLKLHDSVAALLKGESAAPDGAVPTAHK